MQDRMAVWKQRNLLFRMSDFYERMERWEWHKKPLGVFLLYLFIASLAYLGFRTPPPGEAVAALAVAAAIMALLGELRGIEKVAWILLLFGFLWVELTSIKVERKAQEDIQKEARAEQLRHFSEIGQGIQSSIEESDRNFNATMHKTTEVLENVTGGNSFGFVVPQPWGEQIPLVVWNHGDHPLTGVTLTIARLQEEDWGSAFYKPIYIGTIGPHDHAPVPQILYPKPEPKSGQDSYWIMIAAQNGTVTQSLYFRKNRKGTVPWAYSYNVGKLVTITKAKGPIPKGATTVEPLLIRHWSDEVDEPH